MRLTWDLALLVGVLSLAACTPVQSHKYDAFFASQPRSILVLPVLNETTTVEAGAVVAATVARPLAERGYYVFPIYLSEVLLRDLGASEAGYAHQAQVERLREFFGTDAVMYVTVKDWGTKYLVFNASTDVEVNFVLRDARTGTTLWEHDEIVSQESSSGNSDPIGMLIAAAIGYALNQMIEPDYRPLAVQASTRAFGAPGEGLPLGPYHPGYGTDHEQY